MPATYVIGDIHGALKALKQLITQLPLHENDHLIFLGDYVNGWSESAPVINYLMALSREYPCIFIKGNHDEWWESRLKEWLNGAVPDYSGWKPAQLATISSYQQLSPAERALHVTFFSHVRDYYIDENNRLFIHAGFMATPVTIPFSYSDRTLWELALTMDKRVKAHPELYPKKLLQFKEIYIGHTPTLIYDETRPMNACNVYNVDTGAAYTGKLSAMNVDTKEVWQSDCVHLLYPHEKGRNA